MSGRNRSASFVGAIGRSGKARWLRLAVTVLVLGLGLAYQLTGSGAGASPTNAFEIDDGNIADGPAATLDWANLFGRAPGGGANAPIVSKNAAGFIATSFSEDSMKSDTLPVPPCSSGSGDLTVFTSGGSDKNGDAIPTLTYQSGSIPPSDDDLTNVYAAAKDDAGHKVFYFALERSNTNGSAHVDFEFLKAPMSLTPTGTDSSGCPSGHFSGSRTVGDILLSLNYTNGGTVGVEDVRVWDGNTYELAPNVANSVGLFQNDNAAIACGDWRCRDASGVAITQLPADAFTEGYIDATALGISGCFSTFNAKSRSSHSYTSELKDFALGSFNTCDANISVTPNGVNEVGDAHTFTGHVNVNPDGPFVNAPAGTIINFAKVGGGPGSFVGNVAQCATIGSTGSCSVTLTSPTAGTSVVSASTTVQVGPLSLTRSTNGNAGPGGSGNAVKEWADGYVKITPDGVNPVNHQHVFTAEFGVMPGGADKITDVSINADVTLNPSSETSTCATPTHVATNVWQCTVTINSSSTGVFTANATGSAKVAKTGVADVVTITRSTDATVAPHGPGGSGPATKTYVDARISVGPNGLNEVNDHHTVTGKVDTKDGNGTWIPAAAGTTIEFARVSGPGGFVGDDHDCTTVGATGACTVQITSPDVGPTVVNATATVTVHGVSLTRSTDANVAPNGPGGSGNLTKKWADASIKVVETAVNEVNHQHVFTVTATAHRPANETVAFSSITPSVDPTPGSQSTTCGGPVLSGGGLVATCTFTINNATPGTFDVDATAVVTFDDGTNPKLTVTRSTDPAVAPAGPNGNAGATKKFVDARVSVGPDGVNAVGDPHTVIGKAEFNDASGWAPAAGKTINFAITQGVGGFVGGVSSCVAGVDGTCSVAIVSSDPGVTWVSASTSYPVLGVALNRTTSVSGPTDEDNLRKEWVAASIAIEPDAVNPVGKPHTFTITVTASSSGAPISFGAVTTSVTPAPKDKADTCGTADRKVANGVLTCTLTINSDKGGVFTANASAHVSIGTVGFDLATNGAGGSGPAVKTYVDADIHVAPNGVNAVGDPHVVTGHVNVDEGAGKVNAPAGTFIDFTIVSGPGSLTATGCATLGATGSCSVTLNSSDAGVTVVQATSNVNVKGVLFNLSTNGQGANGSNLTKRWIDAFITIGPDAVNPLNKAHTFTVTVTAIPSGAAPVAFQSIAVDVSPAPGTQSTSCATPQVNGNVATCTITINSAVPGKFVANATAVVKVASASVTRSTDARVAPAGPGGSGPATKTYEPPEVLGVKFLPRTGAFLGDHLVFAAMLLLLGVIGAGYGMRLWPIGTKRR